MESPRLYVHRETPPMHRIWRGKTVPAHLAPKTPSTNSGALIARVANVGKTTNVVKAMEASEALLKRSGWCCTSAQAGKSTVPIAPENSDIGRLIIRYARS